MAKKLRLALVGENIEYSRSPAIFSAICEREKASCEYDVRSVSWSQLETELHRLAENGVIGLSITTPHKEAVMPLLDEIDPVARTIGAVNCVAISNGRMIGYNTDWSGLAHALEPHATLLDSHPALVIGTGGAARAAIYVLWKAFDVGEYAVASRSPQNVVTLKTHLERMPGRLSITPTQVPVGSDFGERTVVNCTPLGGYNHPDSSPFVETFDWSAVTLYCDLNYNRPNHLIDAARAAGRPVVDGSSMLVAQALDAFEIWTGRRVHFGPVYEAVFGGSHAP